MPDDEHSAWLERELERLMPAPKRYRDDVDFAARFYQPCPICNARRAQSCYWSQLYCVHSWCSHDARRALITPADMEAWRDTRRRLRYRPAS